MVARTKRIFHDENTRAKIQTTQIIKRLTKHILAEPESVDGNTVIEGLMSQSQVTAALGLIKKTLPDLSAVEHSGEIATNNADDLTEAEIIQRLAELNDRRESINASTSDKDSKKVTH